MKIRGETSSPPALPKEKTIDNKTFTNFLIGLFFLLTLFPLFFILNLQTISADIISLNSGGTTEIAVGTDRYVEGFFFGNNPVCGNGILESQNSEQCDDGNTASGDGCSSTCQTEVGGGTGGGGPGGGGGGGAVGPSANISLNPTEFNVNLAIDTTRPETITVTNLGMNQVIVGVSQQGLGNHIILTNTSLIIPAGGSVDLEVVFVALSTPGIYTGTINIGGHPVLVSLNVKTELLLFDSNIVVLNKDLKVPQGDKLNTRVTLIPLGDPERLDVTLNFVIKDYANKVYLTKSETLLVRNLTTLDRSFDTGLLPVGDYIVGLELIYPDGVAPSSAHFKVVEKTGLNFFGKVILFLIIMILVVAILILIILLWKRRKKKEEEERENRVS